MNETKQDRDQIVWGAQQPGGEEVVGGAAGVGACPCHVSQLQDQSPHQATDNDQHVSHGQT